MMRHYLILSCLLRLSFASIEPQLLQNRRRGHGLLSKALSSENENPQLQRINCNNAALVNRLWPPWPFNNFDQKESSKGHRKSSLTLPIIKTKSILLWAYLRERAKIGTLQLQQGPYPCNYYIHVFQYHVL